MRHSQALLMPHAIDVAEALERNGGMSTVQLKRGRAVVHRHINMAVQVRQCLAFQMQLVMARNESLDNIRADLVVSKQRRHMARSAGNTACAAMGHQRMTADEAGMVGAARHRRTMRRDVIPEMCTRSTAGNDQSVVPCAHADRVVTEATLRVPAKASALGLGTSLTIEPMAAARTAIGITDMAVVGPPTAVAKTTRSVACEPGAYGATVMTHVGSAPINVKTVVVGVAAARDCCATHCNAPYSFIF